LLFKFLLNVASFFSTVMWGLMKGLHGSMRARGLDQGLCDGFIRAMPGLCQGL
jgi:hypothetical protein